MADSTEEYSIGNSTNQAITTGATDAFVQSKIIKSTAMVGKERKKEIIGAKNSPIHLHTAEQTPSNTALAKEITNASNALPTVALTAV